MGHLTGVATQLKKEEPSAIEVICLAHCLNLCLQDAAKMSTIVRDCLGLIGEISQLIHYSPKRSLVFNKCKNELNPNSHGLKPLCPTRWTVRTGAIESVIENYQAQIQAFEEINGSSHDDYGRRAGGVLAQLQKFQTYFGLELCYLVFAVTEEVSLLLQGKSTTLQDALQQADTAKSYLQRQRSDEAFRAFYKKVFEGSKDLKDAPCLARKRRPPKRIDDGSESHVFETPEDYYRKTYFEVIDIIVLELSQRFSQESLRIPLQIESTLLKATNMVSDVENGNIDETLLKFYAKDLDGKKLLRQIAMLPDLVNEIKKTSPYDHLKSVQMFGYWQTY